MSVLSLHGEGGSAWTHLVGCTRSLTLPEQQVNYDSQGYNVLLDLFIVITPNHCPFSLFLCVITVKFASCIMYLTLLFGIYITRVLT